MTTNNPYNYNLPVEAEMFFGRHTAVSNLAQQLLDHLGDSIALIGGRRMGKTSMLEALERVLEEYAGNPSARFLLVPIFLDLSGEDLDSVSTFWTKVYEQAQMILAQYCSITVLPISTTGLKELHAPTFRFILETWGREVLKQKGLVLRLILLLDECEEIVNQPWSKDLHDELRYLLVRRTCRRLIKVVMAGSHAFLTNVKQEGSPLWNILTFYRLHTFDAQSIEALILQPTSGKIHDDVAQSVAEQTGGQPFLIQYIMHHLWNIGLDQTSPEIVCQIAERFPYARNDFWDWINALGPTAVQVFNVLISVNMPMPESDIRRFLGEPSTNLPQVLDALCYHGVVNYHDKDSHYSVAGNMFRSWFALNLIDSNLKSVSKNSIVNSDSETTSGDHVEQYRYDVFISYSHADKDWVYTQLLPKLEEARLKVIIDYRDFEIGVPSLVNIERAVADSRHTLVVLTANWIKSEWTAFESLLVGTSDPAGRRKQLIPIMLESCHLPTRIALLTYADFTRPQSRSVQLERLVGQLR